MGLWTMISYAHNTSALAEGEVVRQLIGSTDVFIIVDVLSFSTCVDIATARDAIVYPYRFKDESAAEFANKHGAILAKHRNSNSLFSLSPVSMLNAESGMKIVLPSPNGATLSLYCSERPTLCGSLRNAAAVARYAASLGERITVIAAGERNLNGSIRYAIEDVLGAGAILSQLQGQATEEAEEVRALWQQSKDDIESILLECPSGVELIERNAREDVILAAQVDCSSAVPMLHEGLYYQAV